MSLGTRRRARGRRADLPVSSEISVTSLVDVAFTLLVIFIITAPIMQGGIEVSIPKADVQPLTSQDSPFFITVTADGTIYMEETPVTAEDLQSGLGQLLGGGAIERVYIRGDSLAPFGPVVRAMSSAQNSGINWSIVAEPYRGN
jgi:biopolymer transport protein TolR